MAALALIRRELAGTLRTWRALAVLVLLLLLTTLFVLGKWPDGTRAQGAQMGYLLRNMLSAAGLAQLGLGLFLLPGLAGTALSAERERGSYEMLRATLIGPWALLLGKAVNVLGLYLLLVTATLPVVGIVFFLIGVSWPQFLLQSLLVYASAAACVSVGLLCSARFARTVTSAIAGYIGMLCCMGVPFLFIGLIVVLAAPDDWTAHHGIWYDALTDDIERILAHFPGLNAVGIAPEAVGFGVVCPFYVLALRPSLLEEPVVMYYAAGWQLLIAAAALLLARRRLARAEVLEPVRVPRRSPFFARLPARLGVYLIDPEKRPAPMPDAANPVLLKEFRWGLPGRGTALARLFYGFLLADLLLLGFVSLGRMSDTELVAIGMLFCGAAACLFAPALLANGFTKEYAQDNIDMLRMTLVPSGQVLWGKLAGGAALLLPILAPTAVTGLAAMGVAYTFRGNGSVFLVFGMGLATVLCMAVCCMACALVASVTARTTTAAFFASYGLALVALGGLYILASLVAARIWPYPNWAAMGTGPDFYAQLDIYREGQVRAGAFSPFVAMFGVDWGRGAGRALSRDHAANAWLVAMAGNALFSCGALLYARRRFMKRYRSG